MEDPPTILDVLQLWLAPHQLPLFLFLVLTALAGVGVWIKGRGRWLWGLWVPSAIVALYLYSWWASEHPYQWQLEPRAWAVVPPLVAGLVIHALSAVRVRPLLVAPVAVGTFLMVCGVGLSLYIE